MDLNYKAWIDKITFSDTKEISLGEDSITVIVGSNNSGKSRSLKDAYNLLSNKTGSEPSKAVIKVSLQHIGLVDDLKKYIYDSYSTNAGFVQFPTQNIQISSINSYKNSLNTLGPIADILVGNITTKERLNVSNKRASIDFDDRAKHPLDYIYINPILEKELSTYFKRAFDIDITLNTQGKNFSLHIGEKPNKKDFEYDREYSKALHKLQQISDQGDGMQAFCGVLLSCIVPNKQIILLDEPEAFLHPPQAKLMGQLLSSDFTKGKQMIIATHSEEVLKGILDNEGTRTINMVRIDLVGNVNHVSTFDNKDLKSLWSDPLLRYSNILSGIFHKQVILCEGDGDCRFFSAITDALFESESKASPDVLFTHVNGKHRLKTGVKALKGLNMPVKVIVDIDILDNETTFKTLLESLDGDFQSVKADFKVITNSVSQKRPELDTNEFKTKLNSLLTEFVSQTLSEEEQKKITALLKKTKKWEEVKNSGKTYFQQGQATIAFENIVGYCITKGLYIIEVGELEQFYKRASGHGPSWLSQVFHEVTDLVNDAKLKEARDFVKVLFKD
ncbi:MAG: AAA family ATPase [Bacteroidota bacterium]